jgi:hypothetical protein
MRVELIYNINYTCVGYNILADNNNDENIINEIKSLFWLAEPLAIIDDKSNSIFTMIDNELASAELWEDDDE